MAVALPLEPSLGTNYYKVREVVSLLFDTFYSLKIEGEPPANGLRILMPTHQNSLDDIIGIRAIREPFAFVYAYYKMPHIIPGIKPLNRLLRSLNGVEVTPHFIEIKKFFSHLKRGTMILAYPQGDFQPRGVESFKAGIAGLVKIYEESHPNERVSFIPVGIEYKTPKHLPKMMPIPFFHFPVWGTEVTIRYGEQKYLDGRTPHQLTQLVMQEAARLSNLPYKASRN